jgi:TonB family protein
LLVHAAPPISSFLPWSAAAILTHLWQSTIVGVIILLLLALGRGLTAATRRNLAWMGLLKFILPAAVFSPFIARVHSFAPSWPTPLVVPALFTLRAFGGGAGGARPAFSISVMSLLALAVWAGVAGALFSFWIIRGVRVRRRILAEAGPVSESAERQLMSAADRVGLWPIPHCLAVSDQEGAGVMGTLSSIVVIPRSLEGTLTPGEFKAILIHECIHELRSDNLWSAIQAGFLCLFWFNPVVWLLSQRISLETEQSCDEAVIGITADPQTYCRGIVKTIRHSLGLPEPGFAGAATAPVIARLHHIGDYEARGDRRWRRRFALGLAGAAIIFSGYAGSLAAEAIETPIRPLAREGLVKRPGFLGAAATHAAAAIEVQALGAARADVFELTELDQAPKAVRQPSARYPFEMRQNGITGTVVVDFTVGADGTVENPTAADSSESAFEDAAVYAVSQWHFQPGLKRGIAVRAHLRVPIVFELEADHGPFPGAQTL